MADTPLQPQPQHIGTHAQITGLLRRLMDAHALVHITLPGENEYWLSAVIDVHAQDGYLLLDELTPHDGNARMAQARRVIVSAQVQGVDISFTSQLLGQGTSDGLVYYRLAFPEQVRYWQRRASYRARVGAASVIPVMMQRADRATLQGELFDISSGGVGTRHKKSEGIVPMLGEVWEHCQLHLPDGQDIVCALEIRFIGRGEQSASLRLGGRFVDITRPQLKQVENFVAALERERLRKARRIRES
jgi:c-di-GMP-binding flagellar brake protein YcgR